MVKHPVAGAVKTRLAGAIGVAQATRTYRTILARTLRQLLRDPRWETWLAIAPDMAVDSPVWPAFAHRTRQGHGNLGDRMQRLFDTLPPGPTIVVGSDIPGIRAAHIAEGFSKLGDHDAVVGPATDGGYWLIGQRRMPRTLRIFDHVRWSSPYAREDTLAQLRGLSVGFTQTLRDLDTAEDFVAWRKGKLDGPVHPSNEADI